MTEDLDIEAFQRQIISEFRENGGKVGGMFEGATLCLLTTVGARSGLRRTVPLMYLDIDGQPLVVGSAGGSDKHPAWFHNIKKNPTVTVEVGTSTYEATAVIVPRAERDRLFLATTEVAPGYADYQAQTTRLIPIVTLHRQ
jgi:deazaflavin-dependent oxidoreductase (nitroreductase family)